MVKVQKAGLGNELMRRAIQHAESLGTKVKTISGNLMQVNQKILLEKGLEATPTFKLRTALGFKRVIVSPSEANSYKLIMGR